MAVEARAPCGDCNNNNNINNNNNNNNNNKSNINKNNNRFYFYDSIFICKQESAREGELSEDRFMTPDNNSDPSLEAESAQMRYFFEV
jgi:hypothetical protein